MREGLTIIAALITIIAVWIIIPWIWMEIIYSLMEARLKVRILKVMASYFNRILIIIIILRRCNHRLIVLEQKEILNYFILRVIKIFPDKHMGDFSNLLVFLFIERSRKIKFNFKYSINFNESWISRLEKSKFFFTYLNKLT